MNPNNHVFRYNDLTYNIRPFNLSDFTHLRCVLSCENQKGYSYLDKLDLYHASSRRVFIKKAVLRVEESAQVLESDLTKIISALEELRAASGQQLAAAVDIPPHLKQEAIDYLKHPDLINNIVSSFHSCGYVGEELNLITAYLAATSRLLNNPLSLMIMSRSGAGKSAIQDAVLKFMPEEGYQLYTRLTDQVLYYKQKDELRHKLIAIQEERGARGAGYSIRNLLTSHGLSINSTIKDPITGELKAMEKKVHGPVSIIVTTTAVEEIDYELLNRFIVITIDESSGQTERILIKQRREKSLDGIISRRKKETEEILQKTVQRLLKPYEIVNPYYDKLKFDGKSLIMRRKHLHYLGIIDAVALLRQYQKEVKTYKSDTLEFEYIEVDARDIEIANKIASKVIADSNDELMPPARNLHKEIIKMNEGNGTHPFYRRDIRKYTGWNDYQIKTHLRQLTDLEYIGVTFGGGKGNKCQYELLYDGNGNKPMELIDVNLLQINS